MREVRLPGRPREFDGVERLRRIMKLFWEKGYEGLSLAEIMAATNLNKGSLYAAYGDKRSMYLKSLALYEDDVVKSAVRFLKDPKPSAEERLQAFLSAPLNGPMHGDRSGCFLCNASADQADLNKETQRQVSHGFQLLENALVVPIKEISPSLSEANALSKARAVLATYMGLRIMVRTGAAVEGLKQIPQHAFNMVSHDQLS